MKYIKLFEENEILKIGDYVRYAVNPLITNQRNIKKRENIYQIKGKWSGGFYLKDTGLFGYRQPDQFWIKPENLELVPEHEIVAMKYNI